MQKSGSVDEYLKRHSRWVQTLKILRNILRSTELEETIKWGIPTYTLQGKNVAGLAAFKNHAAIWFIQGALLEDKAGKLVNAQQGKTPSQRQWPFSTGEPVDEKLVRQYVLEAIENQKTGCAIKKAPAKALGLPVELVDALAEQPALAAAFEQITLYKKREFAEYISDAKREPTRASRLKQITPMILAGKSLNDRYRS